MDLLHLLSLAHTFRRRATASIGLLFAFLLAVLMVAPAGVSAAELSSDTDGISETRTIDDRLYEIARRVPAFGGVYVEPETATTVIYLTDTSPAVVAETREALARALGAERLKRMRIARAEYGFLDLKEWHNRLTAGVLNVPGVVLADIDDTRNRLSVGIESPEVQASVQTQIAKLGVPAEVVDITPADTVDYSLTLRDRSRDPVGGQQLTFLAGGVKFICSLGFGAIRQGAVGFVTNSHCSANRGVVDGSSFGGTVFHQPNIGFLGANIVGLETADPPFLTGGACPSGRLCRYSDALFAENQVPADRGVAAWPASAGTVSWDGTSTVRVLRERDQLVGPLVGESVSKVGRSTGRTTGNVLRAGAAINVRNTTITMLAQSQAGYASSPGDSGAPVLAFPFADPTEAELLGIHWGSSGTFSPIGNIQFASELGSLNTCADPLSC